jgi:hypothetical protein
MSSTMAPDVRDVDAPGRRTVYSMCSMCSVRCPIEVTVEDGRVVWLQGNPHDKAIGASLCAKGSAGLALEYDDDQRPQTPLIRMGPRGGGQWRRASWDEALDYIADKLKETIEAYGARGIALSDRSGSFTDLTRTFVKALGSPNYFTHDACCTANAHNAALSLFGFSHEGLIPDLGRVKHVVLYGRNVIESLAVKEAKAFMAALANGMRVTYIVNGDPKPHVDLIKKTARVYPLASAGNPSELTFVNVTSEAFCSVGPGDYTFWEYLNDVVQEEPSESLDPIRLGFFASIGIQKGKPFAPDARMKKILEEAAAVGDATARALTYRMRDQAAYYYPNSAWRTGFLGGYGFQEHGALLLDSYAQFFFYATGVTPAMEAKMVGQGSQYALAFVDANGEPMDGGKNYRLHLPPNIPVNNFWSVIVYDNQTRSHLQTDQEWPTVTSQNKNTQVNADGSVDVYFGPEAPVGKASNWVQTIPGKGWNIIFRLYGPLDPWFDKTWRLGEIELQS